MRSGPNDRFKLRLLLLVFGLPAMVKRRST